MSELNLISVGLAAIIIGFLLVVAGTIISAAQQKKAEFGFVGFIGPFPIGFGTGKDALFLTLLIAMAVIILMNFMR